MIYLPTLIYQQLMYWVDKAPGEVSGLGQIEVDDGAVYVNSVCMLPQKNGPTSTDIDPDKIAKAMHTMRNEPGELRFWWHSHVNMDVFWSSTDLATLRELRGPDGWFAAVVLNKKQEMKGAIAQSSPVSLIAEDVEVEVLSDIPDDTIAAWDKEYKENIIKPPKQVKQKKRGKQKSDALSIVERNQQRFLESHYLPDFSDYKDLYDWGEVE